MRNFKLNDLFDIRSGDYHSIDQLDPGNVPLVSCGDTNNGVVGFFDIPAQHVYKAAITVAYNGSWPLLAKYHPYEFGTKDDVAVLVPRKPLAQTTLLYVAAVLCRMTWRYSYGRKCYREKLTYVQIPGPADVMGELDERAIAELFPAPVSSFIPEPQTGPVSIPSPWGWRAFKITELVEVDRGDFHSIADLDPGPYMTVSRSTEDNGIVGYFDLPEGATVYPPGRITVSTVGADAFVQVDWFIATDNVLVLTPIRTYRITTLFFIAFALNRQKWRYSYGRQCYVTKFSTTEIYMPVTKTGDLDEDYMGHVVENAAHWNSLKPAFEGKAMRPTGA